LLVYTGESVIRVFFITAASFSALSIYGYTTKKNLSGFGSFLMMGLVGLIIASIVNIFIASSFMQFIISIVGVLIFAGLTAYDTQRIKLMYMASDSSGVALKKSVMGDQTPTIEIMNCIKLEAIKILTIDALAVDWGVTDGVDTSEAVRWVILIIICV
jgi:hypothetical protein